MFNKMLGWMSHKPGRPDARRLAELVGSSAAPDTAADQQLDEEDLRVGRTGIPPPGDTRPW